MWRILRTTKTTANAEVESREVTSNIHSLLPKDLTLNRPPGQTFGQTKVPGDCVKIQSGLLGASWGSEGASQSLDKVGAGQQVGEARISITL